MSATQTLPDSAAKIPPAAPDPERLQALHGQVLQDCNASLATLLVTMGERLGLFEALAANGPQTSAELARQTNLSERNVREWLATMAAGGYVQLVERPDHSGSNGDEAGADRFTLTPEQATIFLDRGHPAGMLGPIGLVYSMFQDEPMLTEAFRHGRGLAWGDHHACLFCSTDRFFGPLYRGSLVQEWLPALEGVVARLEAGADVADVGCGGGTSSVVMAQAFPNVRLRGFDPHAGSLEDARRAAEAAGIADRVQFEQATAKSFDGEYDLICIFDALHDMGDPVGAAVHARHHLKPGGTLMLVEPYAEDSLRANLRSERAPVSRFFYAASTLACVPASQAQEVGAALGAQAGKSRLRAVLHEAGFEHVRIAAETMTNLIIEARD